MKRYAPFAAVAAIAMTVTACGGDAQEPSAGGGGGGGGTSDLGSSIQCDASPSEQELLDYEVPKADEAYDITVMQVSMAGYYYQAIDQGAHEAAEKAGVTITALAADGYASPEQQLRQVEDAIQRGTDAIVMAPSDIQGSVPVVEAAQAAGIPIVNISSEVASDTVHMVMQDDYTFGQMAADRIAEVLGDGGGKGIVIAGPANATWSQRRTEGFEDRVAEKYPDIEVVAAPTQLVDPAEGLRSFEDAVQATPDIDWVFAVHYYILQPASLPTEYRGKIPYVGGGYEPDSISALEDGSMNSVFGLTPRWMGILGVGHAVSMLNGEELPRITCAPIPLFTKEDIGTPFADAELIP